VYNDLNPKAVTNNELFGIINPATREWRDGKYEYMLPNKTAVKSVYFRASLHNEPSFEDYFGARKIRVYKQKQTPWPLVHKRTIPTE
jgi:hypothetical protein